MAGKRGPKKPMTEEHKAALSAGRAEGRAVRAYLNALRSKKSKRGRRRTPDSINQRLAAIEVELTTADPVTELKLVQERLNLRAELEAMSSGADLESLEEAFVAAARSYGKRNGISYAAWRAVGVQPSVLRRAGITRSD